MGNTKAKAASAIGQVIYKNFAKDHAEDVLNWIDRAMTIYKSFKDEKEKAEKSKIDEWIKGKGNTRIQKLAADWEKNYKAAGKFTEGAKKLEPPVKASTFMGKLVVPKDASSMNKAWFDKTMKDMMGDVKNAETMKKSFGGYKPPDFSVGAINKMYLDVINKTKGVTEAKAAVSSALKAAEGNNPSQKSLEAAKKSIKSHSDELKKSSDKKAKDVIKKFEALTSDIDEKIGK